MGHLPSVQPDAARRGRGPGQVAFEFVLMLPFFIAFMLLAVDFGMLMYQYVSVANAAREGARYGAVICYSSCDTLNEIKQRTLDRSGGVLSLLSEVDVWYCDRAGTNPVGEIYPHRGDSIVVSVSHPYPFLFVLGSPQIGVVSSAEMLVESTDPSSVVLVGGSPPC